MIRVFLVNKEAIPDSLNTFLISSDKIKLLEGFANADVLLIFEENWNRASLDRAKNTLVQNSKPVLVLCNRFEEPFSTNSILGGEFDDVLTLDSTNNQILWGLHAVAAGLKVLHDSKKNRADLHEAALLTPRELEILRLIADGEGNKSIAYVLGISEHTVKFHISSIFEKLSVFSRTEAVKEGITTGFISI